MIFQFTSTDTIGSILNQMGVHGRCHPHSFSPYGECKAASTYLPGYNGERCDPLTDVTHLGNGYRAYNSVLRRFHAPDRMSPFDTGGINCYAYCSGNPINNSDPSAHMSIKAGVGLGMGIQGLVLVASSFFGMSIAAKMAVAASVVAIGTGIASASMEKSYPEASAALGWVSMGLGATAWGGLLAGRPGSTISNSAPSRKMYTMLHEGMSGRGAGRAAKKAEFQMDRLQAIGIQREISEDKSKRQATAACDSGSGIVRLELLLNQMGLYSWKTLPTGELNHAQFIPTTLNFILLN